MFSPSPAEGVLRQGEIVSGLIQVHLRHESLGPQAADVELEEKEHPYALILTQDCDLDWDFKARATHPQDQGQENKRQSKLVPNILFCELITTEVLRPRLAGADILRRIQNNLDERFHCLPAASSAVDRAGEALPELVADFKRVFSIPTDEVYLRLGLGMQRRMLLNSPFLQHLSSRFGYYCLRVALPENLPAELPPAQAPAVIAAPAPEEGPLA